MFGQTERLLNRLQYLLQEIIPFRMPTPMVVFR